LDGVADELQTLIAERLTELKTVVLNLE